MAGLWTRRVVTVDSHSSGARPRTFGRHDEVDVRTRSGTVQVPLEQLDVVGQWPEGFP